MKKTFNIGGNINNNSFLGNNGSNIYSKMLDDIIFADIIDKNSYLFKTTKKSDIDDIYDALIETKPKKKLIYTFDDALNFIINYKKYNNKYKLPFELNKMYTLPDGTPIIIYDDEIQIGFKTYRFDNLYSLYTLGDLKPATKKTIIDIYIQGAANININIL